MIRFTPFCHLLFLSIVSFFQIGCGTDFKVDFKMNEQDVISSNLQPTPSEDSLTVLTVLAGDTILIRDVTQPKDKINSRIWTINGEKNPAVGPNTSIFPVHFQISGFYKITLCINDYKPCESKWIHVPGDLEPVEPAPSIALINPTSSSVDLRKGKRIAIEVQTENVANAEDLSILQDNEPVSNDRISFDIETGILKANIKVKQPRTSIEVYANTAGGIVSEQITLKSSAFDKIDEPTPPPPPPPRVYPPTARIYKPTDATTKKSRMTIEIGTSGITSRNQISLKINNRPASNIRFSDSRKRWVAENIKLEEGENKIEVVATNSAGTSNDSRSITFEKEEDAPPPPPPPPPPPVVADIGSKISRTGVNSSNISLDKCTDYSVSNSIMTMKPKRKIRLMGADVFSSGCGSLTIQLSVGNKNFTETFELSKGKCPLTFFKLDDNELPPDLNYKLTMTTGSSSNCEGSPAPTLLNAKSCGQNSNGDENINLSYGGTVSLFKIKYQH